MQRPPLQYVDNYFSRSSNKLPCLFHPLTVGGPMDIRHLSSELHHRKQILRKLNADYCGIVALMQNICSRMGINFDRELQSEFIGNEFKEKQQEGEQVDAPQRPYVNLKFGRPRGDITMPDCRKRQIVRRFYEAAKRGMTLARFCLLNNLPQREVKRWISSL